MTSSLQIMQTSVYEVSCFNSLSLDFSGYFPGEPGLAGVH